jgi:hypothetical protein
MNQLLRSLGPSPDGASPIVGNAVSTTTVRICGAPIIGDVHDHRVCAGLRRGSVVVAQDAAEALATRGRCSGIGVLVGRGRDGGDQPVVEALVVALEMVVLDELRDREAEVALAERNELVGASDLMESTMRSATEFRLGL